MPGIHYEYRVFSNFLGYFEKAKKCSGAFLAHNLIKSAFCGSLRIAAFSCLFPPQKGFRNTVSSFLFVFPDQVGIEILCGADFVVAQLLRHRDHIRAVRNQDGCYRVAECVGG